MRYEYGIVKPAAMPDMSGTLNYILIVNRTFDTEEQAEHAMKWLPKYTRTRATIMKRTAPGEWE